MYNPTGIIMGVCLMFAAAAAKPSAVISVLPGPSAITGGELLFDAGGTTVSTILQDGRFVWDFGDGMRFDNGLSCTHIYTNPGTYTVSLYVMDPDSSRDTASTTVTVTGDVPLLAPRAAGPELHMKFDGDLSCDGHAVVTAGWQGTASYVQGKSGQAMERDAGYVTVSDSGSLGGGEMTISVWARQADRTYDQVQYLLYKDGLFHLRVTPDDWSVNTSLAATGGNAGINMWISSGIDDAWHHYVLTWDETTLTLYIDGVVKATGTGSGGAVSTGNHLEIGSRNGGSDPFDGYIDDLKIFDRALSAEEVSSRFELWHADFHGRIGQEIIAKIPPAVTGTAANSIKAVLTDGGTVNTTLLEKSSLDADERFVLDQSGLDAGDYILTVQLIDGGMNEIEKIVRKFTKGYDGIPRVGVNRHNAICIDGEPFFPVTPFILNKSDISTWGTNGYINTTYSQGWYSEYTAATWLDYTNASAKYNLMCMGPGHWETKGSPNLGYMERNGELDKIGEYISAVKDSDATLFYIWDDEPDLGGDDQYIPAQVIRAWTMKSHLEDPEHPVSTNLVGPSFIKTGWHFDREGKFNFMHNARIFGQRTHIADVYGMDYYPVDWAPPAKDAMVWKLAAILDTMRNWNADLVPYMSFIETSNIKDDVGRGSSDPGTPPATPEQLLMLTWINMVHGCKGINWFQHFTETSTENYAVMAEFVQLVDDMADVILGPDPGITVTSDADAQGVRVDHMVRDDGKNLYLFTVRVNEMDEADEPAQTVTFTLPSLNMSRAVVINESRSVEITSNTLADEFAAYGVHLYKIPYGDTIFVDVDGDGYGSALSTPLPAEVDCNDTNAAINPGMPELCDGIDNNCAGGVDEGFPANDEDSDGLVYCLDNCPSAYNPLQADFDYDGIGDSCDLLFTWAEDFELREEGTTDLRDHKKNNDFTWQFVFLMAGVSSGSFSNELRMDYMPDNNTFVATDQSFSTYTLSYDVRLPWAADNEAGVVLYFQDRDNYIFLTHGGNATTLLPGLASGSAGLYVMEGGTPRLVDGTGLNLPHKDGSYRTRFSIETSFSGNDLVIDVSYKQLWDDSTTGSHTYTVANTPFTSGAFGYYSEAQGHNHLWIDNIELETAERPVYTGLVDVPVPSAGCLTAYPNPAAEYVLIPSGARGSAELLTADGRSEAVLQPQDGRWLLPDGAEGLRFIRLENGTTYKVMIVK